jgi:hypothetical protein
MSRIVIIILIYSCHKPIDLIYFQVIYEEGSGETEWLISNNY